MSCWSVFGTFALQSFVFIRKCEICSLAEDYRANEKDTQRLFSEVQNKLFFAVTGHTAAELIVERSNPDQPNMGLMSFAGDRVRKADVVIAKNYLNAEELDHLNRLVSMFFDFAELRAKQKQHLTLASWRDYINNFMTFNEQPLLSNAGQVSRKSMEKIAGERYDQFNTQRNQAEALEADRKEMEALEHLEKQLLQKRKNDSER